MLPALQLYLGAMESAFTFMQAARDDEDAAQAAEERWLQLCQRVVQVHTGFNASQVSNASAIPRWLLSCKTLPFSLTVACCVGHQAAHLLLCMQAPMTTSTKTLSSALQRC